MLYSLSLLPLEVFHLSYNEGSAGLILWIIKTLSNYKNYTTCHRKAINMSSVGIGFLWLCLKCALKVVGQLTFDFLSWIIVVH